MRDIMGEYISVAEFSRRINISKAKAYNIIDSPAYKNYVSIDNGIKQVAIEAVELYLNGFLEIPIDDDIEDIFNIKSTNDDKEGIDYKYILDIQSKRIEELERQLQEKDKVILDYANKFAEMATQAQSIAVSALTTTGQAQYLQATQQATQQTEKAVEITTPEDIPVAKKTLWQRIFSK